jgi:hypothetical protein
VQPIYHALRWVTVESDALGIPEPLLKLADIRRLRFFVSTTFDSCLVRALNAVRFGGASGTAVLSFSPDREPHDVDVPQTVLKSGGPVVYHLLGKVSAAPTYAVTQWDMVEYF